MCHKCLGRSTAILAALLAASVPAFDGEEPVTHERDEAASHDIADLCGMLAPAMKANGDPDAKAVAQRLADMGLQRTANMFSLADYMRDSLRHVVELAVTAMQGSAERGDLRAITWLIQNADELKAYGIEVQTALVTQMPRGVGEPDFMRPRGAQPPVS